MPEHPEIKELLSGTSINYFHCLRIVEILKETEAGTKNFFGQYGSQRMSDWKQIVSLYERDQVYIAEAAQLLVQAVAYDLPAIKKQIQKCTQIQEECNKKEKSNLRKVEEFENEFDKGCKSLGIEGKSIRKEIISLLDDLPDIYANLAQDSQKLAPHRKLYQNFISKVHKTDANDDKVLPNLNFLMSKGNVTTYEWVHGEPPLEIVEPQLDFGDDEENAGAAEIDFNIDEIGDVELDTGGEINWDNLDSADAGIEIDWGAVDTDVAIEGLTVEESGNEGGVARESDALSILDNRKTRNLILDELHELQAFFLQRQCEMSSLESGTALSLVSSDAEINDQEISAALTDIKAMIGALSTGKLHHLQLVKGSPKYVDRLVGDLKQKTRLIERTRRQSSDLKTKKDQAALEQNQLQSNLTTLMSKTKTLQKDVEKDISKRYKGRKVNIMGGVQSC